MSAIVVRIDGLGKKYKIHHRQPNTHPTLKDVLASSTTSLKRSLQVALGKKIPSPRVEEFWALRNVSLEIGEGDRLGIIGRNGAGKSTLLKILSRITEPTTGTVRITGRVASLLEVGTGFHPELTGRENIFLNGAVLGMPKAEILRKFDEIVAFAEVEKFLDTPVKRYSSGMYVRLAFAVAAHLEPEILIVDEVLAVGDAEFQKKCIGKMQDVSRSEGRTVLFVSHNMDAIQGLCSQCVLLEGGTIAARGEPTSIVGRYLASHKEKSKAPPNDWISLANAERTGAGGARIVAVRYRGPDGTNAGRACSNEPIEFDLSVESSSPRSVDSLAVTLYSPAGVKLVNADTVALGKKLRLGEGDNLVRFRIDRLHLNPGVYSLGLWVSEARASAPLDSIVQALELEVFPQVSKEYITRPDSDGVVTCSFKIVDVP